MEEIAQKNIIQNYVEDVYFVNDKDEKVFVHCHYKIIIQELTKLGIYNSDSTIEVLLKKLDLLLYVKHITIVKNDNYREQIRNYREFHNKTRVLYLSILDVWFYLYDYNESKMPCKLRKIFTSKYL